MKIAGGGNINQIYTIISKAITNFQPLKIRLYISLQKRQFFGVCILYIYVRDI